MGICSCWLHDVPAAATETFPAVSPQPSSYGKQQTSVPCLPCPCHLWIYAPSVSSPRTCPSSWLQRTLSAWLGLGTDSRSLPAHLPLPRSTETGFPPGFCWCICDFDPTLSSLITALCCHQHTLLDRSVRFVPLPRSVLLVSLFPGSPWHASVPLEMSLSRSSALYIVFIFVLYFFSVLFLNRILLL